MGRRKQSARPERDLRPGKALHDRFLARRKDRAAKRPPPSDKPPCFRHGQGKPMKRPADRGLPCGARSYASLLFAIILLAVGNLHQIRRTAARGIKGAPKIGAQKP